MYRSVVCLIALYLLFFVTLIVTAPQLPPRVAQHFNAAGQANGWASPTTYVVLMVLFGVLFPLLLPAILWLVGDLPDRSLNVPRRDYWLTPEHRAELREILLSRALWLACLEISFVTGIHLLVVEANRRQPPHLPGMAFGLLLAAFLAAIGVWGALLVNRLVAAPRRPQDMEVN
jgi:uncharacterized membrane protein